MKEPHPGQLLRRTVRISPFLDGKLPSYAPVPWEFRRIYHSLEIEASLVTRILPIPGLKAYLLLGKEGKVWTFDAADQTNQKLVLDISDRVATVSEAGLTGFAFHPGFNDSSSTHFREVFMFYNYQPGDTFPIYNRLTRLKFSEGLDSIYSSSEEILIQQYDQDYNHNAGEIFFGNEGFLYMTLGDEGKWQDWYNNAQKLDYRLFSGIIRIDVDMDTSRSHPIRRYPVRLDNLPDNIPDDINQNYFIPDDNPWVDESGQFLEEFYAIGLRNPYTAFYDTLDGRIWVGDVGEGDREEITVISRGSNAQWAYKEGTVEGYKPRPENVYGKETPPIYEYVRKDGRAVIGGIIYRGDKYPELYGNYIFGDFESGNVWAFDSTRENSVNLLTRGFPKVVDFFTDYDGSLCALSITGEIYKLEKREILEEAPQFLSELNAFDDLGLLISSNGIMPYEINSPLWSDGAVKKRWIALPDTSKVVFNREGALEFPVGTVFIKHFEMPLGQDSLKKLETRFFVIDRDRNGYGITYKWDDKGTDAELVGFTESPEETIELLNDSLHMVWSYPSRGQCLECHNQNANYVLGLKASQLNRLVSVGGSKPENQLMLWQRLGLFKNNVPSVLPQMSALTDTSFSLTHRIKSYLDANCSHCHRPGGVNADFDTRFSTLLTEQNMLFHQTNSTNSTQGNNIVTPGSLEHSELWIRDQSLGFNKMPPIAKNSLDEAYLALLKEWILELDSTKFLLSQEEEESITVFPNPVTGDQFEIVTKKHIENVQLYDLFGRNIRISLTFYDQSRKALVSLPQELKSGIYYLVCYGDKVHQTKLLVR